MQNPRLRARYRYIMGFFARLTWSLLWWEVILPGIGMRRLTRLTRNQRLRALASGFRTMAIRAGGVMIKVGQFLSTRLDMLPAEITEELSGLQDEVPPEDFADIRALAEAELGAPLDRLFERFETEPMAAASLGQVHRARLKDDAPEAARFRDVVVKIQRPLIGDLIEVDFAVLRRFGGWLRRYRPLRRRVDVLGLIQEMSDTVKREIDYMAEAGNAEQFAANFASRPRVHVPRVAWSRTTQRVLTLEDVFAVKITDYEAITAAGIDRAEVADLLFDTYLKQIFEDDFFHADPHPGNLFVTPVAAGRGRKASWNLTFVDFGMVGTVPDKLLQGLREALIGVATRDAGKVVAAYQSMGVLLPGADVRRLEQAEARLFDRYWGMSMSELRKVDHVELRRFAHQFRDVMLSMPFQLPENLLLLGRTFAILTGMCTGLDPEFNMWKHVSPYAGRLVTGDSFLNWEFWLEQIGDVAKALLALPAQTGRVMSMLEHGQVSVDLRQVSLQIYHLEGAVNRIVGGFVAVALLAAGTVLYQDGDTSIGYALWGVAGLSLVWTLFLSGGHRPAGD